MMEYEFTAKTQEAVSDAVRRASGAGHPETDTPHLLLALLSLAEGTADPLLKALDIAPQTVVTETENILRRIPSATGATVARPEPSRSFLATLSDANRCAEQLGDKYLSSEHLLVGLAMQSDDVGALLQRLGATADALRGIMTKVLGNRRVTSQHPESSALKNFGTDLTARARTGQLDPVVGRDTEIRRVIQVLSRRTKNNPVLIGEPGVGKTAIAEGLAQRIVAGDVPESLRGRRIISLDLVAMVAGTQWRGQFEARIKAVLDEIKQSDGEIVTFIDELHTIVGSTDQSMDAANMLKPMLSRGELRMVGATTLDEYREHIEKDPALERRFQPVLVGAPSAEDTVGILRGLKERYEVHHGVRITDAALVAAATLSDRYVTARFLPDKAIDLIDEAASRLRMEIDSRPVEVDEVARTVRRLEIEEMALSKEDDESSKGQLIGLRAELGQKRKELEQLTIRWKQEKEVIERIREIKEQLESVRGEEERAERDGDLGRAAELRYGRIPELERQLAAAFAEVPREGAILKEEVWPDDVAEVISLWTGIPAGRLLEGETAKLLRMEEVLSDRVVGQSAAVHAVSDAVRRARAGLSDPGRPTGSFLFLGPTGVGKTELAKALAEFMFDDERAMIRLDMSEFGDRHTIWRLTGASLGYQDSERGGQLTEAVRRRPYSVVLFDEIEKAHPEIFNLLLQLLDDGRLTDGRGRTVDFSNTVVIFTSNLGSDLLADPETFDDSDRLMADKLGNRLREFFKPEFINRLDRVVAFHPLGMAELTQIVDILLTKLSKRLASRHLDLSVTSAAREWLALAGFDPVYGARPLRRLIETTISDPLARALLAGEIRNHDTVSVDVSDDQTSLVVSGRTISAGSKSPMAELEGLLSIDTVPPDSSLQTD